MTTSSILYLAWALTSLVNTACLIVFAVRLNRLASKQATAWAIQAEINNLLAGAITKGDK